MEKTTQKHTIDQVWLCAHFKNTSYQLLTVAQSGWTEPLIMSGAAPAVSLISSSHRCSSLHHPLAPGAGCHP